MFYIVAIPAPNRKGLPRTICRCQAKSANARQRRAKTPDFILDFTFLLLLSSYSLLQIYLLMTAQLPCACHSSADRNAVFDSKCIVFSCHLVRSDDLSLTHFTETELHGTTFALTSSIPHAMLSLHLYVIPSRFPPPVWVMLRRRSHHYGPDSTIAFPFSNLSLFHTVPNINQCICYPIRWFHSAGDVSERPLVGLVPNTSHCLHFPAFTRRTTTRPPSFQLVWPWRVLRFCDTSIASAKLVEFIPLTRSVSPLCARF